MSKKATAAIFNKSSNLCKTRLQNSLIFQLVIKVLLILSKKKINHQSLATIVRRGLLGQDLIVRRGLQK